MVSSLAPRGRMMSSCRMQASCALPICALVFPVSMLPLRTVQHAHPAILRRGALSSCRRYGGRAERLQVHAGWGADVEWSKARIVEASKAAEGLVRCTVDIGDLAQAYTKGGQYLQIKVGESKPAFYAIASKPSSTTQIELLVKNQGDTAEILCDSKAGDAIDVSPIMGNGFPTQSIPPEKFPYLFIFATGTGIAPIKALIESGDLQADQRKVTRLYYGTFNPESTAYQKLVPEWEAAGIQVAHAYSGFGQGYVQDVFAKEDALTDGPSSGIILCGQKEMNEAVRALVSGKGVADSSVITNF